MPANIGEVRYLVLLRCGRRRLVVWPRGIALQHAYKLTQGCYRSCGGTDHTGLAKIGRRHHRDGISHGINERDDSHDRTDCAVKAKLAHKGGSSDRFGLDLAVRYQHPERDRQI